MLCRTIDAHIKAPLLRKILRMYLFYYKHWLRLFVETINWNMRAGVSVVLKSSHVVVVTPIINAFFPNGRNRVPLCE
jgi:hypothetical protein